VLSGLSLRTYLGRIKVLLLICGVSLVAFLLPPLDALENTSLTARMAGGVLMVVYSLLLGYGLERYLARSTRNGKSWAVDGLFARIVGVNRTTKGLLFGLVVPACVLIYWNFPSVFDLTALNVYVRYASYFSFIAAGILAGTAISYMSKLTRIGILLFSFLSVGGMGSMMLVWPAGFYTVYSPAQNIESNTFLMLIGSFGEVAAGAWSLKSLDVV
jgi:Protein of unknown function (DUF1404)